MVRLNILRLVFLTLSISFTLSGAKCFGAEVLKQGVFDERVRTLRVKSVSDNLSTGIPVIVLNASDRIVISFDILETDRRYLRYELIHCNADWTPSTISYPEYLDGFNEGRIEDYEFSMATTVPYIHYTLVLPNEEMQLLVSGNYVVRIYDENDPEQTLVQARFCVSENTAPIAAAVTSRTDVDTNRNHQQLEIAVDCERSGVVNLYNDVLVVIEQNGRMDNIHYLRHPLRVSGTKVIYEHLPDLIFEGGNEYRRFETVSNFYPGMNIDAIEYHAPYYNQYLVVDYPRSGSQYQYDQTLKGGFFVREYNSENSDIEADYVVVHFALEMPELFETDIFLDNDVFNRELGPESRMVYNRGTGRYEKAALLKQGAYSYQYLALPTGQSRGRTDVVEGDKYQTGNMYTIYVYSRRPSDRYDRLIGRTNFYVNPY